MHRRTAMTILWLLLAVVALFAITLSLGSSRGEFGGTDATATDEIAAVAPDYEPWFEPFWTQPGGEVESGLFALQAAIGAGILGFVLGSYRERRAGERAATAGAAAGPRPDAATT